MNREERRRRRRSQDPRHELPSGELEWGAWGMSLRDWLAGQALAGLVVTADETSAGADLTAGAAYEYADAMLKARDV